MGAFTSTTIINAPKEFIPYACRQIKQTFEAEGFEYTLNTESYDKTVITIAKGNFVKQIVGLKQGLEISFAQEGDSISISAKGTVIKDQAIATAIMLFITWPVVIPQIIGLIKQSKLDDRVIEVVNSALSEYNNAEKPVFCPNCGTQVKSIDGVCANCGERI